MVTTDPWGILPLVESEQRAAHYYGLSDEYWNKLRDRVVLAISPRPTKEEYDLFECVVLLGKELLHGTITNV